MDEQEAMALLRAQGLTPERCGETDWRLALEEVMARGNPKPGRPARPLLAPLRTLLAKPAAPPSEQAAPVREYQCPHCEDEGYVLTATRDVAPGVMLRERPVPCPACVPLGIRAALAGIPARFCNARLDTLIERSGNEAAVDAARAWDGSTSVVLASRDETGDSPFGTGKTHIACAMLIGQIARARPARFMSAQDFLEAMKRMFDATDESAQEYADRVASEPLLCIDDLGKAQDTDWSRAQLFRLIDARYRAQRPTIITTNASFGWLTERFGGALVDRLSEAQWVYVGGTSMRGELE